MSSLTNIRRTLTLALGALTLSGALLAGAPHAALAQRGASRAQRARTAQTAPEGVVNIQTATVEQLQLLPGVGPSKAEAIVAHRQRRAFRRVEDILRVRGIGRATFRRLRSMLTVDGPTTMAAPSRRGSGG